MNLKNKNVFTYSDALKRCIQGAMICIAIFFLLFLGTKLNFNKKEIIKEKIINKSFKDVHIPVKISVYQPLTSQCDDSPFLTANNDKIDTSCYYHYCAVSRDLLYKELNFNDTIILTNAYNDYEYKVIVKDMMNSRIKSTIDILIPEGKCYDMLHQKNNPLHKLFYNDNEIVQYNYISKIIFK